MGKSFNPLGGAALTGYAGIAALTGVVAAGGLAIYGVGHHAARAQNAVDHAQGKKDELGKKVGNDLMNKIAENKIAIGEKYGWSEERIQAEITKSYASMRADNEQLSKGFFGNWWDGIKNLLGVENDAAKKNSEAADKLAESARLMEAAATSLANATPAKRRPEARS